MDDTAQSRLRVSDADRDAAVTELGQHFQAGRLDAAELDDRTGRALRARVRGDLDPLLADLPRPAPAPVRVPQAAAWPARPPLARSPRPGLIAAIFIAALIARAVGGGWHHGWGGGVGWWPVLWLIPLLAARLLWWRRRSGGARS